MYLLFLLPQISNVFEIRRQFTVGRDNSLQRKTTKMTIYHSNYCR